MGDLGIVLLGKEEKGEGDWRREEGEKDEENGDWGREGGSGGIIAGRGREGISMESELRERKGREKGEERE